MKSNFEYKSISKHILYTIPRRAYQSVSVTKTIAIYPVEQNIYIKKIIEYLL